MKITLFCLSLFLIACTPEPQMLRSQFQVLKIEKHHGTTANPSIPYYSIKLKQVWEDNRPMHPDYWDVVFHFNTFQEPHFKIDDLLNLEVEQ
jgi:hypothetical protein